MRTKKAKAKAPTWTLATVRQEIRGKLTRWPAGMVVKARRTSRWAFMIERVKWVTPKLPLTNSCCNVRPECLELHGGAE